MVMESNLTFHHKAEMIFQDIAEFFFANGQKGYESAFLKVTVITLTQYSVRVITVT